MLNSESKYNQALGKLLAGPEHLSREECISIMETLNKFEQMLDEGDMDDCFGTEGWRHNLGWD